MEWPLAIVAIPAVRLYAVAWMTCVNVHGRCMVRRRSPPLRSLACFWHRHAKGPASAGWNRRV